MADKTSADYKQGALDGALAVLELLTRAAAATTVAARAAVAAGDKERAQALTGFAEGMTVFAGNTIQRIREGLWRPS